MKDLMMQFLGKGVYMTPTKIMMNNMLNTLDEGNYNTAISFIQFLSDSRKKKKAEQSKKYCRNRSRWSINQPASVIIPPNT